MKNAIIVWGAFISLAYVVAANGEQLPTMGEIKGKAEKLDEKLKYRKSWTPTERKAGREKLEEKLERKAGHPRNTNIKRNKSEIKSRSSTAKKRSRHQNNRHSSPWYCMRTW